MNAKVPTPPHRRHSTEVSRHLNLADPAERFMAGWIARFHGTRRQRYEPLAVKRVVRCQDKKPERFLYELARGLTGGYLLLTWNIDEVSMRWLDFSDEQAAKTAMAQLVP